MPAELPIFRCVVVKNAPSVSELVLLRWAMDSNDGAGGCRVGSIDWSGLMIWQFEHMRTAK